MYRDTFFFKALSNVIPQLICFPNKFSFKIQQQKKNIKVIFLSFFLLCCSIFLGEEHKHIFMENFLLEKKKFLIFIILLFIEERFFLFSFRTVGKYSWTETTNFLKWIINSTSFHFNIFVFVLFSVLQIFCCIVSMP